MKIFSSILAILILVPVLCFALSNRTDIAVALWPFEGTQQLPLYVVGLVPLMFGLIVGGLWGWGHAVPHLYKAHRLHKELGELNNKIGDLQKAAMVQPHHHTHKKHFWERKA